MKYEEKVKAKYPKAKCVFGPFSHLWIVLPDNDTNVGLGAGIDPDTAWVNAAKICE